MAGIESQRRLNGVEREQRGEREVVSDDTQLAGQGRVQAVRFGGGCRSLSNGNSHVN